MNKKPIRAKFRSINAFNNAYELLWHVLGVSIESSCEDDEKGRWFIITLLDETGKPMYI